MGARAFHADDFRAGTPADCPKSAGNQNQEVFGGVHGMINTLIASISIALNAEFDDKYKIHREAKKQGLQKPCFFIQCLNPTEKLFFWKRYFRQNQFCIQYFPEEKLHGNQECCAVAEQLLSCLEYLDVGGDPVMGT